MNKGDFLREYLPLKQGLRQRSFPRYGLLSGPQRVSSIKTRIKTVLNPAAIIGIAASESIFH